MAHLLIAHRDPAARAMLDSMLHGLGYDSVQATGDDDALQALAARKPDLVLVGIDGDVPGPPPLLSDIRRMLPAVPAILLLPRPDEQVTRMALRMGATSVLRFPIPSHQLRAAIQQCGGWDDTPKVPTRPDHQPPPTMPVANVPPIATRSREECEPVAAGPAEPCRPTTILGPLKEAMEEYERAIILRALEAFGGCRKSTAEALKIDRTTLYKKMRCLGLL